MSSSPLSTIKGSVVSVPEAFSWRFSSIAGSPFPSPVCSDRKDHVKMECYLQKIGNEVAAQGIDDRSYSIIMWMENLNNCTSVGIETASSKAW